VQILAVFDKQFDLPVAQRDGFCALFWGFLGRTLRCWKFPKEMKKYSDWRRMGKMFLGFEIMKVSSIIIFNNLIL